MASTRLRLVSLFAATVIVVGACSSTPKASGPAGSGGTADCAAGSAKGDNAAALQVPDVRSAVNELRARGVTFEDYDTDTLKTTDGIAPTPDGKEAAWFKDSEGNVLVLVAADGRV